LAVCFLRLIARSCQGTAMTRKKNSQLSILG
jgi:hypothetical protein